MSISPVWEYVAFAQGNTNIPLDGNFQYRFYFYVSSSDVEYRLYAQRRDSGVVDLIATRSTFHGSGSSFFNGAIVDGATYSHANIVGVYNNSTGTYGIENLFYVRLPKFNDPNNPYHVWELEAHLDPSSQYSLKSSAHQYWIKGLQYSSNTGYLRARRRDTGGYDTISVITDSGHWGADIHGSVYSEIQYTNEYGGSAGCRLILANRKPYNVPPAITLASPAENQSLNEGNAYQISGSAADINNGNVVTIKYQINTQPIRALSSAVSNGTSPISFAKNLTFSGNRLYDGTTDVSGPLTEGVTYTLKVWAEDDQGGISSTATRSFTIKINKSPKISVNPYSPSENGLTELDAITLSGTSSDPDGNTITVTAKINSGTPRTLLSGVSSGNWSFTLKMNDLQAGANSVAITATDQFGKATTRTFQFTKTENKTPLRHGVARYKMIAPSGSAKEYLMWLKRQKGDLAVTAEASFVDAGQPEQYFTAKRESVELNSTVIEDEFVATATSPKSNIVMKLTLMRSDASSSEAIKSLVGVIQ